MYRFLIFLWIVLATYPAHALLVKITNVSDFNLGSWSIGDPGINASMDLCIYAFGTLPAGSYGITASGGVTGFVLSDITGLKKIPYEVFWEDSGANNLGSSAGTKLSNNVSAVFGRANAASTSCASGLNARLNFKISQASMVAAKAGDYTGSIILLLGSN